MLGLEQQNLFICLLVSGVVPGLLSLRSFWLAVSSSRFAEAAGLSFRPEQHDLMPYAGLWSVDCVVPQGICTVFGSLDFEQQLDSSAIFGPHIVVADEGESQRGNL